MALPDGNTKNGEKVAENCQILDCLNCEVAVIERSEKHTDGVQRIWEPIGKRNICIDKHCAAQLKVFEWKWAGKFFKSSNSYESQKPGLYSKVKAAQAAATSEQFRVASDPVVNYVDCSEDSNLKKIYF